VRESETASWQEQQTESQLHVLKENNQDSGKKGMCGGAAQCMQNSAGKEKEETREARRKSVQEEGTRDRQKDRKSGLPDRKSVTTTNKN
jgi:hypothetical protein